MVIKTLTFEGRASGRFRLKALFKKTAAQAVTLKPGSESVYEQRDGNWYDVESGERSLMFSKEFTQFQQHCDYEQKSKGYSKDYV